MRMRGNLVEIFTNMYWESLSVLEKIVTEGYSFNDIPELVELSCMEWNAAPELIAAIVLVVLIVNSKGAYSVPSLRNTLFTASLWFTTACLLVNSLSVFTIVYATSIPSWINVTVNSIYFLIYPVMSSLFISYILLFIFEQTPERHRIRLNVGLAIIGLTVVANIVIVVANVHTGWLFSFDSSFTYVRGPFNRWTFYMAVINIVVGLVLAFMEYRYMDPFFLKIIGWFPFLSLAILIIQQLYRELMLSGTAMMMAILSVYLNFQGRRLTEDYLTKVANREAFATTMNMYAQRRRRFSVVLVSVDDFKLANDTFGREKCDRLLASIAAVLTSLYPHQQVYRYSGDEFAIIFHGQRDYDAEDLAQAVRDRLKEPVAFAGLQTYVDACTVLLRFPFEYDRMADPITLLDYAIRLAKNRGKSQHVTIDYSVYAAMRRRNQIIERLKAGMDPAVFRVEYQPIFDTETNRIVLAEALLRMNDPVLKEISPKEFIPIAEEYGIIDLIGLWVFEQACSLVQRMQGLSDDFPAVTVNFSGRQFSLERQTEQLLAIHRRYGAIRNKLKLEVTESTFIGSDYPDVLNVMQHLQEAGIGWLLDDFGTGYSNFTTLVKLPFESIKLDRSLATEVLEHEQLSTFVRALIAVIVNTGAQVIVEGVETLDQVEHLRSIGCRLVQGYVYSHSVCEDDFIALWMTPQAIPLDQTAPLR